MERFQGVSFESSVKCLRASPEELDKRIAASIVRDSDADSVKWRAAFRGLGIIAPAKTHREPASLEVLGYYDSRERELLIRSGLSARNAHDTILHELTHAWQDQQGNLDRLRALGKPFDVRVARRAFLEGHATVTSHLLSETNTCSDFSLTRVIETLEGHIKQHKGSPRGLMLMLFGDLPYVAGARFVCELREAGGMAFVRQALVYPPQATVEVLFPDRFLSRLQLAMRPMEEWRARLAEAQEVEPYRLGAFFALAYLAPGSGVPEALRIVESLDGDTLAFYGPPDAPTSMTWTWIMADRASVSAAHAALSKSFSLYLGRRQPTVREEGNSLIAEIPMGPLAEPEQGFNPFGLFGRD